MCEHNWSPNVYNLDTKTFERMCASCHSVETVGLIEAEKPFPLHNRCANNGHLVTKLRASDFMLVMLCTRCDYRFEVSPEDAYGNPTV